MNEQNLKITITTPSDTSGAEAAGKALSDLDTFAKQAAEGLGTVGDAVEDTTQKTDKGADSSNVLTDALDHMMEGGRRGAMHILGLGKALEGLIGDLGDTDEATAKVLKGFESFGHQAVSVAAMLAPAMAPYVAAAVAAVEIGVKLVGVLGEQEVAAAKAAEGFDQLEENVKGLTKDIEALTLKRQESAQTSEEAHKIEMEGLKQEHDHLQTIAHDYAYVKETRVAALERIAEIEKQLNQDRIREAEKTAKEEAAAQDTLLSHYVKDIETQTAVRKEAAKSKVEADQVEIEGIKKLIDYYALLTSDDKRNKEQQKKDAEDLFSARQQLAEKEAKLGHDQVEEEAKNAKASEETSKKLAEQWDTVYEEVDKAADKAEKDEVASWVKTSEGIHKALEKADKEIAKSAKERERVFDEVAKKHAHAMDVLEKDEEKATKATEREQKKQEKAYEETAKKIVDTTEQMGAIIFDSHKTTAEKIQAIQQELTKIILEALNKQIEAAFANAAQQTAAADEQAAGMKTAAISEIAPNVTSWASLIPFAGPAIASATIALLMGLISNAIGGHQEGGPLQGGMQGGFARGDNNLGRFEGGEHVMPRDVAQQPGVMELLEAIRQGGGLGGLQGGGPAPVFEVHNHIHLDGKKLAHHIEPMVRQKLNHGTQLKDKIMVASHIVRKVDH